MNNPNSKPLDSNPPDSNPPDSKPIDPRLIQTVTVVDYDSNWATIYKLEKELLLSGLQHYFVEIEHIGSTAVPMLKAKPIIDIMTAIETLDDFEKLLQPLRGFDYEVIETDMENRFFLRKIDESTKQQFHLHVVSLDSWPTRKERIMRDYLLEHPKEARAYGTLKTKLAEQYPDDSLAYTQAKTDFIQELLNKAHAKLGLSPINVWEDQ